MTGGLVVTGASGYLGSYLLRSASRRGYAAQGVVRAQVPWLEASVQQVAPLLPEADAAVEGADTVVHLAAPNETSFRTDPAAALQETVAMSRSVARACARTGVRRLLCVSTVHVYGSALRPGAWITEETPPAPIADYGRSRLISEQVMLDEAVGIQLVILRLTNGVGCPVSLLVDRWTLVANDLCRQAATSGRLRLAHPGQWRDFIPLDAVANVILDGSNKANEQRLGPGIYNLSAGRSITVLELAQLIAAEAKDMKLQVSIDAPVETADPPYRVDNSKIRHTGLLPDDLSLSGELRNTVALCLGATRERGPLAPGVD